MTGHCFTCGILFDATTPGECYCITCRPSPTWGVAGLDDPPAYIDYPEHLSAPFSVLVDTREQLAYTFLGLAGGSRRRYKPLFVPLLACTLPCGDYSIDGMVGKVIVERKTFADFCSSFGGNREVELRKFDKIASVPSAFYMCEFAFERLLGPPPEFSRVNMASLLGTVTALQVRAPQVQWCFAGNREL